MSIQDAKLTENYNMLSLNLKYCSQINAIFLRTDVYFSLHKSKLFKHFSIGVKVLLNIVSSKNCVCET